MQCQIALLQSVILIMQSKSLDQAGPDFVEKQYKKTACMEPAFVSLPKQVYDHLEEVTLTGDVIFINGLAFFITFTWKMKLVTAKFLHVIHLTS
jgi:hypothetical protein